MNNISNEDVWININKPINISSAKIVSIIKRITKAKKVGHAGTLDPLASGVLPIALNKATKTTNFLHDYEKKYLFQIKWGNSTSTADSEGEIISQSKARPTTNQLSIALLNFIGSIEQKPHKFSAIKINGKRAYELARNNISFEIESRMININSLKLNSNNDNFCEIEVVCSKGTYIRSLAVDICKILNCDGYVSLLKRLQVGEFKIEDSLTNIENLILPKINLQKSIVKMENLFNDTNKLILENEEIYKKFSNGCKLELSKINYKYIEKTVYNKKNNDIIDTHEVAVFYKNLITGLAFIKGELLIPKKIFKQNLT